jgi:site-specific DNA recombinase
MFLGYARVSSKGQADGTSLDEQERKIKAIASLRGAGPYDLQLYVDEISGSTPMAERDEGRKLLSMVAKGDTVIACKLDRMFRNAIDALSTAEQFKRQGIELILVDISSEPVTGNGVGKLFFGIMAQVAEFERERINERTSDGRRAKREKKGHLGGAAPFGYVVQGTKKEAVLVPVPAEQETLAKVQDIWKRNTPASACREAARLGLVDRAGHPFRIVQLKRLGQRV